MPIGKRASMTPEEEIEVLKDQAEYFENALREINKRIQELTGVGQDDNK